MCEFFFFLLKNVICIICACVNKNVMRFDIAGLLLGLTIQHFGLAISGIIVFSVNVNSDTICNGGESYPMSLLYWVLIISIHKLTQCVVGTFFLLVKESTSLVVTGYILIVTGIELGLVVIGQVCFNHYVIQCYKIDPFSMYAFLVLFFGYIFIGLTVLVLIMTHLCDVDVSVGVVEEGLSPEN